MRNIILFIAFIIGATACSNAQEFHMPKPSPTVSINQGFSTSFIKIKYSRPGVKGRNIFGDMIPYGKVWRTGANECTKITFGQDLILNGHPIKAGEYALYTIPNKDEWTIILNTGINDWGSIGYSTKKDVLRFKVPVKHLSQNQESFRISIENLRKHSCSIDLAWAKTQVSIPVKANDNQQILDYLSRQLKGNKPPYRDAAAYYYSTNYKLKDALNYATLAIKQKPKAWYLYWLQAQIYQKLGNHTEAVAAAKKSADLAKGTVFQYEFNRDYQNMLKEK